MSVEQKFQSIIEEKKAKWSEQPMLRPKIGAVQINMSLGKAGDPLTNGMKILEEITRQKPVETYSKQTWRKWGIRKGQPVGAKVTIRGKEAYELLMRLFHAKGYQLKGTSFDKQGNFGFGIVEHIDIPGMQYQPGMGIVGFDVNVQMVRAGYRVKDRKVGNSKLPTKQFLDREDTMAFLIDEYKINIV
jgi:large subunit ribosomal protein L5